MFLMQHFLIALALAVGASSTLAAQISVGFRGGATFSKGNYDDADLQDYSNTSTGFLVGVPVEVGLSENFAVQAEANLIRRGQRTEIEIFGLTSETTTRLTYLDATALAKAGLISEELTLAAVAGPSLGYALQGRNVNGDVSEKIDFADDDTSLRRVDFGVAFGFQGGVGIGPGRVTLDGRYRLGLNDLTDDGDGAAVTVHSRSFSIALGYLVPMW